MQIVNLESQIQNYTPLVSVLMTAFNRADFITEAIESVLRSSYKNFELIIGDDFSADQTVAIARKFQQIDSRITVYINDCNLGDYVNRNKIATYANGKYLKYLDSDDLILVDGLEKMVRAMELYPTAGLGIAQFSLINNTGNNSPICVNPADAYLEHFDGQGILQYGPTGTIIRKDIFFELNCFSTRRFLGDTEFWLKLAAKYPIVKIETAVVFWRVHKGQEYEIGHKQFAYLRYSYPIFIRSLQSPDCPLNNEDISRILIRLKWKHARDILSLAFIKGKVKLAFQLYGESDFGFIQLLQGLWPHERMKSKFQRTF